MSRYSDSKLYSNRDRRRGPITEKRSEAIAIGQVQRYEKPYAKKRASDAQKKCWYEGARVTQRVIWTPEMDHQLLLLHKNNNFQWLRTKGANIIGVGDLTLRNRLKFLIKVMGLNLLEKDLSMPKEYNIFTLSDVFYKKFPEKSMKILLSNAINRSHPLLTKVTLGDIALQCSASDAWSCISILSDQSRRDVIKAVLPTIKRFVSAQTIQVDKLLTDALILIEKFSLNNFVPISELRNMSTQIFSLKNQTPLSKIIEIFTRCTYDLKYQDDIIKIMTILNSVGFLDKQENENQVNDICAVFVPIVGIRVAIDQKQMETNK